MSQFVFPAVMFYDQESDSYAVSIPDANIITEGETVESAFLNAKDYLYAFCETSLKLYDSVESSTSYNDMKEKYPKDIVLLVDVEIGGNTKNKKHADKPEDDGFDDFEDDYFKKLDKISNEDLDEINNDLNKDFFDDEEDDDFDITKFKLSDI